MSCRNITCDNLAIPGLSCCSKKCRDSVPNCKSKGCKNAPEVSIYKGMQMYTDYCYVHGGRVAFDGEIRAEFQRNKML